jgi:hypothetical protein
MKNIFSSKYSISRFTPLLIIAASLYLIPDSLSAARVSIEEAAQIWAKNFNTTASQQTDNFILAVNATAKGKRVLVEHIVAIKRNPEPSKISLWASEMAPIVFGQVCPIEGGRELLRKGLRLTYRFMNSYGEHVADIEVDSNACKPYYRR